MARPRPEGDQGSSTRQKQNLSTAQRLSVIVIACFLQSALLWLFFPATPRVEADNTRYEEAGYRLASGQGLALAFTTLADEDVRSWACTRHPERCSSDGVYPTAAYPPGYQVFVAFVYSLVGRRVEVLLWIQCALHLLLLLAFESVLWRLTARVGYLFGMAIAAVYPFLARQAGMVMSDHLHAVLLMGSVWALICLQRPVLRSSLSGFLFAAATLTRPYSVVAVPLLLGLPWARRAFLPGRASATAFVVAMLLPFGAWWLRNYETFGRFIPFTTTGIGAGLYLNKTEWTIGSSLDEGNAKKIYDELTLVSGDITTWSGDRRLRQQAIDWMLQNPTLVLRALPKRLVRSWISVGYQGTGIHPAALGNFVFSGGLLALGCLGLFWRMRGALVFPGVIILAYWAFLFHTPSEARRTLALRMPMLVFAALAVDEGVSRVKRRRAARFENAVDDELRSSPSGIERSPDILANQAERGEREPVEK